MTPEGKLAAYLVRRCKELGVAQRKIHYEGRRGAPDRMVLDEDCIGFIELKAPGKKARPEQVAEINALMAAGAVACIADSEEQVEAFLRKVTFSRFMHKAMGAMDDDEETLSSTWSVVYDWARRMQDAVFGDER